MSVGGGLTCAGEAVGGEGPSVFGSEGGVAASSVEDETGQVGIGDGEGAPSSLDAGTCWAEDGPAASSVDDGTGQVGIGEGRTEGATEGAAGGPSNRLEAGWAFAGEAIARAAVAIRSAGSVPCLSIRARSAMGPGVQAETVPHTRQPSLRT